MAATVPKIPENIPAINRLRRLILMLYFLRLRNTATATIRAMVKPRIGCGASNSRVAPIRPPGSLPNKAYCRPLNSRWPRSRTSVSRAMENPMAITGAGTSSGSTIYSKGVATTAKPKPINDWVRAPVNMIRDASSRVTGSISDNIRKPQKRQGSHRDPCSTIR